MPFNTVNKSEKNKKMYAKIKNLFVNIRYLLYLGYNLLFAFTKYKNFDCLVLIL